MRPYVGSVKMIEPSDATITSFGLFQLLVTPVRRDRLAGSVRLLRTTELVTCSQDDEVAVVVARSSRCICCWGRAAPRRPRPDASAPLVARHVAEVQRPVGHPDRPFSERETRSRSARPRRLVDQLAHLLGLDRDRHGFSPLLVVTGPRTNVTGRQAVRPALDVDAGCGLAERPAPPARPQREEHRALVTVREREQRGR